MYNSIGLLATKEVNRLIGLQMGIIEQSYKDMQFKNYLNFKSINMNGSTPITQVERRYISELEGLLYNSVEFSYKRKELKYTGIKIVKPKKIYKIQLKVLKKYSNTKKI